LLILTYDTRRRRSRSSRRRMRRMRIRRRRRMRRRSGGRRFNVGGVLVLNIPPARTPPGPGTAYTIS